MTPELRRLRVLVATSDVPFVEGGHRVIARSLVAALQQAGHQAELFTCPQNRFGRQLSAYLATWLTDVGLTGDGRPVDRVISLRFPSFALRHPAHVVWLNHRMREYYDLWSEFRPSLGIRGRLVEGARRQLIHRLDRLLLRRCKRVYAQSRTIQTRLRRWGGIDSEVLYPPPPPRPYRCLGNDGSILSVARLTPLKRVALLLDAAALEASVRVTIVGEGPELPALRCQAERAKLRERVIFAGRLTDDELVQRYGSCSAVYYGARAEDYGMVTLEAFASGKPILTCTDSGGPVELVVDGSTGLVVPPDAAALATAASRLCTDRQTAERMGAEARQVAASHCWPNVVGRLLTL